MIAWGINWTVWSLIAGAAAALVFMVVYARVRWWRSPSGQNIMTLSGLIFLIAVSGAMYRTHPQITLAAFVPFWFAVAAVLVWRTVLLWRAQADYRRTHPPVTPQTPDSPTE